MRENTKRKYERIWVRFNELTGNPRVMSIYYQLADEFDMSIERIRQIILMRKRRKKPFFVKK